MLTFDPGPHVYRWSGEPVPSVTQIIRPILPDYSHVPDTAREQGVAIHKMVELHCNGVLDEDTLPAWLAPYLRAWKAFVDESGFVLEASEERVYHETHRYAGTLDLRGWLDGKPSIIDLKRSFTAGRAIGVQTAAYVSARYGSPNAAQRYGLRLMEGGQYRLKRFANPRDWSVFLACLTLHRYQEEGA